MPTDPHREMRRAIVETCRRMNALGVNQGTVGNVSARAGEGFLISPTGVPYDSLTPEQIVAMDPTAAGRATGDLPRNGAFMPPSMATVPTPAPSSTPMRRMPPRFPASGGKSPPSII